MAGRQPPKITPMTPIGPDVDVERDDIRLADGTRLTDEIIDQIVAEVRRSVGRPSLSGRDVASPRIAFRVPKDVRDRAVELAAREGKTISQLAREVLEARVGAS